MTRQMRPKPPLTLNPESAPDTTFTAQYRHVSDVGRGDWLRLVSVQGIATVHELWLSQTIQLAQQTMVYVYRPQSGPSQSINRWNTKEREFPAWRGPLLDGEPRDFTDQEIYDAMTYVLNRCAAEVAAEGDVEIRRKTGSSS